ncbi:ribose-5-phosphate isomerase RKI1 [Ascoidea rubescens DSM 1968]|uniref:Ribose-5-phosphate isomerase n=1 Tax=Ascoidea rubescens DSM 1968 TaxID=1344418 RepID=A0A1D2VIH3_9ASCO|nr:ribose 5-phosphate isomerase [Ascoidea rubescens DSM 1968]ODV61320.1 ribose 5-phosphate isomerase [Ascoidea rubescens DSM 1968]
MTLVDINSLEPLADPLEQAKRAAAYMAVDQNVPKDAKFVGIGSGSTVVYAAERIGQLPNKDQFICIPTSFQSKQLIFDNDLKFGTIDQYLNVDITFDGADEVDSRLNCIKGGGACLFQEKLVASCSKKLVIIADYRKKSPRYLAENWRKGIPIEVVPIAWIKVKNDLINFGARSVQLRQGGTQKAGPVVTDNGNFIMDADFGVIDGDIKVLNDKIRGLVGVVETGLFVDMVEKAYFGNKDGSVTILFGENVEETI